MNRKMSFSDPNACKTLDREHVNQIIEAILAGKYSWACFLLLSCINYEPSHYIPYRTYNRLVKEHFQVGKLNKLDTKHLDNSSQVIEFSVSNPHASKPGSQITDLEYLEGIEQQNTSIKGGNTERSPELISVKLNLILQMI